MNDQNRTEHIEALARVAAELAGRNPDERFRLTLAGVVAFDDVMWRYPDFIARAEAAYDVLIRVSLTQPANLNGRKRPLPDGSAIERLGSARHSL